MCSNFETPMRKFFIILKKAFLVLLALLLLLVGTGLVVIQVYKDEVVGYAVSQFNKQLKTKASIGSIDLAFLATFPKASIKITEVYVPETFPERDTLLFASELYLAFDLTDIIKGKYDINEIKGKGAKAYLKINKKGEDNWHFIKESDADTSKVTMNLQEVKITDLHFIYENRRDQFFADAQSSSLSLEGNFTGQQMSFVVNTEAKIKTLISGDEEYIDSRLIKAELAMDVLSDEGRYVVRPSELSVDDVPFLVQCNYINGEKSNIDLSVTGNKIELQDLFGVLPASYREKAEDYDADGSVSFQLQLKGSTYAGKTPDLTADFNISNGQVEHEDSGITLSGLECSASYIKGSKQDQLHIRSLKSILEGGFIQATGFVYSLDRPAVDMNVEADVQLGDLKQFFGWDTLEVCEGRLGLKTHLQGPVRSSDRDMLKSQGNALLSDARIKLKNSNRSFEGIQASILFDDKNANVETLKGVVNGSDFAIQGKLQNLIPFLLSENERLEVSADFTSSSIDFTSLVEKTEGSAENRNYNFELPKRIDFRLNSAINKFTFGKFEAGAIRTTMQCKGQVLTIDPLTFKTSDGEVNAQIVLSKTNETSYFLRSAIQLKDLDIKKVFVSLDNLGQNFITDQNLDGQTNATIQLEVPLSDGLKMDMGKLHSLIDIEIRNGQLKGLQSLQEIAGYIRSNKWLAPFVDEDKFAESMKDIRFATLENIIEIKNKKIVIPQMDIRSSALDISASGTHGFDNTIDYTIGFRLRDILVRKNKDLNEEDDGLGKQMFIYMRGTTDNPQFGIDKDAAKTERQKEIIAEKQNMKALLKQEFGLFKNDVNVGAYQETNTRPSAVTTVEWEENDKKESQPAQPTEGSGQLKDETPVNVPPSQTTKKGKKLPKWLQEKD